MLKRGQTRGPCLDYCTLPKHCLLGGNLNLDMPSDVPRSQKHPSGASGDRDRPIYSVIFRASLSILHKKNWRPSFNMPQRHISGPQLAWSTRTRGAWVCRPAKARVEVAAMLAFTGKDVLRRDSLLSFRLLRPSSCISLLQLFYEISF